MLQLRREVDDKNAPNNRLMFHETFGWIWATFGPRIYQEMHQIATLTMERKTEKSPKTDLCFFDFKGNEVAEMEIYEKKDNIVITVFIKGAILTLVDKHSNANNFCQVLMNYYTHTT